MVHCYLNGRAPQYLAMLCVPVVAARQHLHSAAHHQLAVPSYRLSTYGRRAFAVAGLMTWNAIPTQLQLRRPVVTTAAFGRFPKPLCSRSTDVLSALEAFATKRYINRHFTLHYYAKLAVFFLSGGRNHRRYSLRLPRRDGQAELA